MPDFFVVILIALGVLLMAGGILSLVGRRRLARHMGAARILRSGRRSGVTSVVALGIGQVGLGILSLAAAGIVTRRNASGRSARAVGAFVQSAGVVGFVATVVALVLGVAVLVLGVRIVRQVWRSRADWASDAASAVVPRRDAQRLSRGMLLCVCGGVMATFGISVLLVALLV